MEYNPLSKPDNPELPRTDQPEFQEPPASHPYQNSKQDRKHSGPGIASFIISLATLIGYVVSFIAVAAAVSSIMNEIDILNSDSSQAFMFLGLAVIGLAALNVIGVVLGIIGLAIPNRRKVYATIGTIVNGLIILVFMLVIATVLVNAGVA